MVGSIVFGLGTVLFVFSMTQVKDWKHNSWGIVRLGMWSLVVAIPLVESIVFSLGTVLLIFVGSSQRLYSQSLL